MFGKGTADLHSNMVRFIMTIKTTSHSCLIMIYIPIWLDLLSMHGDQLAN